jgi:protein-S-isoprenylcysteine O-methyltransferase Ste14
MRTAIQTAVTSLVGFGAFLVLVFLPAGSFDYWRGWAFIAVFAVATLVPSAYAAANVTVESDQQVVSAGLYSLVRHPMYFGNVVLMIGVPLALGSYWALLFVVVGLVSLVARIGDEESLLEAELAGYREYTLRVRFRLVPYIW